LELSKSYLKNKDISFINYQSDTNNPSANKNKNLISIEPYFDNQSYIFFLKTILYLNEEKLKSMIRITYNSINIDLQKEILSDSYANEKHLILFNNNSESRINTLKTISLKIIFRLLTLLTKKNFDLKKFKNLFSFIKTISLDYIKILGDIFTFTIDDRINIFQEKKNESPHEKKLIVYLSNILEMFRLLYGDPEMTIQELIDNRFE